MDENELFLWHSLTEDDGFNDALQHMHASNDGCAPCTLQFSVDRLSALARFAKRDQVDVGEWLDSLSPEEVQDLILSVPLAQALLAMITSSFLLAQLESAEDDD